MPNSRPPLSSRSSFLPEEIARREFGTVFRGYDSAEVRTFLRQLSEQAAEAAQEIADLQIRLEECEDRVRNPEVTDEMMTRALGDRTALILQSARDAAAELREQADRESSALLRDSHEASSRMREEAEVLLSARTYDAEQTATSIRNDALATAEATRAAARDDAARTRAEADEYAEIKRIDIENEVTNRRAQLEETLQAERAQARAQARELIALARTEAQGLVERTRNRQEELIESLVRKRKIALAQVEELRAGRERLLQAYRVVRSTLDDVTAKLEQVEDEARQTALAAGRRAAESSGIEEHALEEEVELEVIPFDDDVAARVINLTEEVESVVDNTAQPSVEDPTLHEVLVQNGVMNNANELTERDVVVELEESEAEPISAVIGQAARDAIIEKAIAKCVGPLQQLMDDEQASLTSRLHENSYSSANDVLFSFDDQSASYQHAVVRAVRGVVTEGASLVAGESVVVDQAQADQLGAALAREFANELTKRVRDSLVPTVEALLEESESEYGPARDVIHECISGAYRFGSSSELPNLLAKHLSQALDAGTSVVVPGVAAGK